ncbi:DciA family protein [Ralstonia pseudosolanacearum]|uniref:DciA family protein n=1 Tax=Ralstonia pseudosolanacearum TaxID=1310165 RepID=UPI000B92EDA3|nr:DciA family protein [Ralstonia pseudosolanacearum]MCD9230066.1 DciA family protein [Ralstonia pseudosolanacearum]UWD91559.1 DciA family protein [Ralstonia pseudosolanacearum]CAH0439663.1 hypothetical protein LMG9673_00445 [Ralstonia pseudosolanacearum]
MRIFVHPALKTPVAKPVQDWLTGAGSVGPLMQAAKQLASLEAEVLSLLPPGLGGGVAIGGIRNDARDSREATLVLLAANSAAAARVRQVVPTLLERLQRRGSQVTAIRVRVQPQGGNDSLWPQETEKPPKRAKMTAVGLNSLATLADGLPDSPLRRALAEMVVRHRPPQ